MRVAIALIRQYKGEVGRLEELFRDNHTQNEKIACLEAQLTKEMSTAEAKLAQERASMNQREKSLLPGLLISNRRCKGSLGNWGRCSWS